MPIFPTDVTTERGHMQFLSVPISNAVNMVSAVYLTGLSDLGSIFACIGEIQGKTDFAEKLGRPKCQFSLPMLPAEEHIGRFLWYP